MSKTELGHQLCSNDTSPKDQKAVLDEIPAPNTWLWNSITRSPLMNLNNAAHSVKSITHQERALCQRFLSKELNPEVSGMSLPQGLTAKRSSLPPSPYTMLSSRSKLILSCPKQKQKDKLTRNWGQRHAAAAEGMHPSLWGQDKCWGSLVSGSASSLLPFLLYQVKRIMTAILQLRPVMLAVVWKKRVAGRGSRKAEEVVQPGACALVYKASTCLPALNPSGFSLWESASGGGRAAQAKTCSLAGLYSIKGIFSGQTRPLCFIQKAETPSEFVFS